MDPDPQHCFAATGPGPFQMPSPTRRNGRPWRAWFRTLARFLLSCSRNRIHRWESRSAFETKPDFFRADWDL